MTFLNKVIADFWPALSYRHGRSIKNQVTPKEMVNVKLISLHITLQIFTDGNTFFLRKSAFYY